MLLQDDKSRYLPFLLAAAMAATPATGLSKTYQAEAYNQAYDTTPGNQGGAYRNENVDIEATSDSGGGYNVGWIDQGEWLIYDGLSVPTAGTYRISMRVASPGGATASVDLNAGTTQLGQFTIPATGGWQNWTTVTRDVTLPAGTHRLGVFAPSSGWNFNWIDVTRVSDGGGGNNTGNKRLLGYFTQWGSYDRGYLVRNIDRSGAASKITHINYAFGNVRNNRCEVGINEASNESTGAGGDAYADYGRAYAANQSVNGSADSWNQPLRGNWNQIKQLKAKYPHIKVLISLGGWSWSRGFSSAARPENRQAFVASCINAYIRGNLPVVDGAGGNGVAAGVFDGIDIDWEYPNACGTVCGPPEDRANYTALLAEFRRQLDAVRPGLLLTTAIGADVSKIAATDPGNYTRSLDFVNIMTYDFAGTGERQTGHHSPLWTGSNDAVEAMVSRGVPASKLNLGIGFYGRGWNGVSGANNGLYQSGNPISGGQSQDYYVLKNVAGTVHKDNNAGATWKYGNGTFWTYDTPEMVSEKMNYVKAQNMGGAFFWEFSGDDDQTSLLNAMSQGLK